MKQPCGILDYDAMERLDLEIDQELWDRIVRMATALCNQFDRHPDVVRALADLKAMTEEGEDVHAITIYRIPRKGLRPVLKPPKSKRRHRSKDKKHRRASKL